ncbi:hypothetical protein ACFLT9_08730 [Acidobacteriota bacterium]
MLRKERISVFKRGIILIILMAVLLGLSPMEIQAGGCEKAFVNCVYDPFMNIIASVFCLNGYIFCKKYIEY